VRAPPPGNSRRLFFALWPEASARRALASAAAAAVAASGGRAVPEANLHLTLAFLGAVEAARIEELAALGRAVAARASALTLDFEALERWRRARVLCAPGTGAGAAAAGELAAVLRDATLARGFSPDLKPFRVHVTVARKVVRAPLAALLVRVRWRCDTLALVESRGGQALYSVLDAQPLGRTEKVSKQG